jgi:hypothetical protein
MVQMLGRKKIRKRMSNEKIMRRGALQGTSGEVSDTEKERTVSAVLDFPTKVHMLRKC